MTSGTRHWLDSRPGTSDYHWNSATGHVRADFAIGAEIYVVHLDHSTDGLGVLFDGGLLTVRFGPVHRYPRGEGKERVLGLQYRDHQVPVWCSQVRAPKRGKYVPVVTLVRGRYGFFFLFFPLEAAPRPVAAG